MYEFPFELDDFQKEACDCISEGESVVVCAPTGAGKTVIAEHAIHCALKNGDRVFYTTPLKALSNQKFNDFSQKYGADKVGLLTGDSSFNRDAQIVVMTTEVFRNMLYCTNFGSVSDNMQKVKYVILDEVHYMNDEQRGTVWEESIIYCPTNVQIIALSATVANADKLTEWINTVHSKTKLINTDFRPVPLRFYYFDSSQPDKLLPLLAPGGTLNKKIRPEKRTFKRGRGGKIQQKSVVKDVVRNLHENDMLPAIYFTFSRKKCDEQMEKCADLCLVTPQEQAQIKEIIDEYIAENPYLYKNKHIEYLLQGVASHHAGLLPSWKVLVEKLFQKGLIKVVFATETLAAGINMPARSTVISSVSKRTDEGHRMLTASEFLQMSGRAGRRGMDKVGYVTIVGSMFQSPEEVAELVLSDANPLESRFSPSYSMVANLLQRFTVDEAKELILKSFGYFSSNSRLAGLNLQLEEVKAKIAENSEFKCWCHQTADDLLEYNKIREAQITKQIDIQRDIFWNKFISHKNALEKFGYIKDDFPTDKGKTVSQIRSENELFLAEIIFSDILNDLTPAELASVICAVTTEDMRAEMYSGLPLSQKVRKTLNKIKDVRRRVDKVQNENNIDDAMYINSFYCALIEMWSNGAEWDDIIDQVEMGEGDVVRCFKRVIDVLRQLTTIDNVPEAVVYTARDAIDSIQREPIDLD